MHASRDSAFAGGVASKYASAVVCSERRLPTDGGPPAPKAAADVRVVAKAVEGIALFTGIPKEDRALLFAAMYQFDYAPGEYIMRQGEEGRNFYIVVSGCPIVTVVGATGATEVETTLAPGDIFGEVALLHGGTRSASVRAGSAPVKTWVLGRSTFRQVLSDAAFARRKKYSDLLTAVKPLQSLSPYARSQLADAVVPLAYSAGDVVLTQDSLDGARFHIIESGSVRVRVGGTHVASLSAGDYFGELCLLGNTTPTATVTADGDGKGVRTIALDRTAFKRMLGEEVQEALSEHIKTYVFQDARPPSAAAPAAASGLGAKRPDTSARLAGRLAGLSLAPKPEFPKGLGRADLVAIKELGVGMTGQVYLCRVPVASGGKPVLAVVKVMSKVKMLRMNQVTNVVKEKQVLATWRCPHIVTSLHAFQDRSSLYLMLEFMAGGDLFQHLCDVRRLSLGPARFYAAEIILALGYIHGQEHVYRDLKPENILMDASGHVKLADMGFCKALGDGEKTYTTCGTADYMAPEVMLCQGYNRSADYWAFGVFVFELLTGGAPFAAKSDRERHAKILSASIVYPADFNLQAKDLVARLCVLDVSHRLGMMASGIEEIKDHTFFADVDWHAVDNLQVKPPFVPRVRSQEEWDTRAPLKLPEEDKPPAETDNKLFEDYC